VLNSSSSLTSVDEAPRSDDILSDKGVI
jgi:hypothetical protein